MEAGHASQREKMVEELGEPSDLGSQFESLRRRVQDSISKNALFKSLLQDIKAKLDELSPLIKDTAKSNSELDETSKEVKELGTVMKQGIGLVEKFSSMPRFNLYKKWLYAYKLNEWKESLEKMSYILMISDMKRTMESLDHISTILKAKTTTELPMLPQPVVGMDEPLSEVKTKLIDDDKVSMLVLTGPGGCGKTTLAVMLCNDQKVKGAFKENILFVTVQKIPNIFEVIVEQLYASKDTQKPVIHKKDAAVNLLQQFLTGEGKSPLLLVLDDVWPANERVLETFDNVKLPNLKILITSTSSFPRYASTYYLKPLDDDSAMALFRHAASLGDESSHIAESLIKKIVKPCKGLPFAITCVGRSLCRQPEQIWQIRAIEMSRGSIFDSETELLLSLQGTLDTSMSGSRECFMDLGSFPEDHEISVAALLDMWMELYGENQDEGENQDDGENQDEEVLFLGNIYKLSTRSLVDLRASTKVEMEEDGYYIDKFVTQHGLLRELAIYLCKVEPIEQRERLIVGISKDAFPRWWRENKYQPTKARLTSISTDKTFSMKWPEQVVQLPEAKVLVLNFEGNVNYVLPEIVKTMCELKVLIVTNLGPSPVELSNFQLVKSLEHMKKIRLEKISMASITKDPIKLESVKKISLYMCDIGQAFPNCPNLEELNIDCCNDMVELPAEIYELTYLETLCVTNCHKLSALPEDIGKLVYLEVLRLRSCNGLKKLPLSLKSLENLNLLDISGCSGIGELPDCFDEMKSLKKINMRQCSSLKELPPSIDLKKLEVRCDEATKTVEEILTKT